VELNTRKIFTETKLCAVYGVMTMYLSAIDERQGQCSYAFFN